MYPTLRKFNFHTPRVLDKRFVSLPSSKDSETNDTSFETPNVRLLVLGKNLVCHHPGGGHTHLIENAILSLKLS